MYSYFKGKITELGSSNLTLEVNNIGYLIQVFNPKSFSLNNEITLYIHQYIKETEIILYGFSSNEQKLIFQKLLTVKGLGPKGALSISSNVSLDSFINAINNANTTFFTSFSSIGLKTAEQIIFTLKNKLKKDNDVKDEKFNLVINALKSLGYSIQEINQVTKKIDINSFQSIEECIKQALKLL